MVEIINELFGPEVGLGQIKVKAGRVEKDETLPQSTREIAGYIKVVLSLNLLEENSTQEYINEHTLEGQNLNTLKQVTDKISNHYIRAYFYDILQVNRTDKYNSAKNAIAAYWEICKTKERLSDKREYYIRIIHILKGLGKGNHTILAESLHPIKRELLEADMSRDCYTVTKIAEELIPLKASPEDYDAIAAKIETAIPLFLQKGEFSHYRECNHALAMLKPSKSIDYARERARGFVMEAARFDQTPNASQHRIASLYKEALQLFKFLGIDDDETIQITQSLVTAQQKAAVQLAKFGNLGPTPLPDTKITMPSFDNIYQGVYWLISANLPAKENLKHDFEQQKENYLHQRFFSSSMSDGKGNTTGESKDNSKLIYRNAVLVREFNCKTILTPAYEEFSKKFSISEIEVLRLLTTSSFIPTDRLGIYTHGIYHGFRGNFVVAVHLLVLQLEHSLRTLLNDLGINTRKLTEEVQTENGLTSILSNLNGVLHEDLLFDLEGLLNEPFGYNLRNQIAHGLCSVQFLHGTPGFYTWWLTLKLVLEIDRYKTLKPSEAY